MAGFYLHVNSTVLSKLVAAYFQKEEVQSLTSHLEKQIEETDSHHQSKIEALQEELIQLKEQLTLVNIEKETAQSKLFSNQEETEVLREKVKSWIGWINSVMIWLLGLNFQVESLEKWESEALEKSKLCDDLQNTST